MMRATLVCLLALVSTARPFSALAQELSGLDRSRGHTMLRQARSDLERLYYDTAFHGVDLDSVFAEAERRTDGARSNSELFAAIAAAMSALDDSHTWFVPPRRAGRIQYGWSLQMIGDDCYVVAVKPESDAAAKHVEVADLVHAVEGIRPTRDNFWKLQFALYAVSPRATTRLTLENADGVQDVSVETYVVPEVRVQNLSGSDGGAGIWDLLIEMENLERDTRDRYAVVADSVFVWQMTGFGTDNRAIDDMIRRARPYPALVLDLRDNHGAAVSGLERLVSQFFDSVVVLDTLRTRKQRKPEIVKPQGNPYRGRLVVLVNSESASAAEMFARIVQLHGRGIVVGDRTAGMVTQARFVSHEISAGKVVAYATEVTVADVVMSDGRRLEGAGVVPDTAVVPRGTDLRAGRDPTLAHAIALLGGSLSAEQAGRLFPRRSWQ